MVKIPKLPGLGGINAAFAVQPVLSELIGAYREYNRIKEEECTKRECIRAQRDVALCRIKAQKKILQQYLQETFKERARTFNKMFDMLDQGLASGDDKAIGLAMTVIVKQIETNPLSGIRELMAANNVVDQINDPNIECIEI